MTAKKEIIVAIEFGSSKIRGVAGYKNTDGSVQVLDIEQADARNCVRKGVIYNIDKTVTCLKNIIGKMEDALDMRVPKVFVGIGGLSVRTKKNTVSRQFATKTVISQEVVDTLLRTNRGTKYAGYEILEVIPQEYHVGVDATTDPVGVLGNQIDGTYLNVIAKTEIKEYILKCVEAAGRDVAGMFVAPMALAGCVLTDSEKRSGCALVDFGYGTTTVAVYKGNLLRHLAVIPLGGDNVTQDLCNLLQIDEDEAEKLKMEHGAAYSDAKSDGQAKNILLNNGRLVEESLLADIVEAREEEILKNVAAQIRNSGYQDKLLAGIVMSGAASNVGDLDKAVSAHLNPNKIRLARDVTFELRAAHAGSVAKDGSLNTLLALMNEGKTNCAEPLKTVETGTTSGGGARGTADPDPTLPFEDGDLTNGSKGGRTKKKRFWRRIKDGFVDFTNKVTEE